MAVSALAVAATAGCVQRRPRCSWRPDPDRDRRAAGRPRGACRAPGDRRPNCWVTGRSTRSSDAPALGLAQTFFAQGAELLANPGRSGAWDQVDVRLLQGIGRLSMSVAAAIADRGRADPALGDRLAGPAARSWTSAPVSAGSLSPWPARTPKPGLSASTSSSRRWNWPGPTWRPSASQDRIELRRQDVLTLEPDPVFDVVWLPLPFLPRGDRAATRWRSVYGALRPGGWLIAGTFAAAGPDRARRGC